MAEVNDDVGLMREMARKAIWDILYHEKKMRNTHRNVGFATAVLVRCGCGFSLEDARELYRDDEQEEKLTNPDDWIKLKVGSEVDSLAYHETSIAVGHKNLAVIKIMIARGKYTEIDLEKIKKEQEERLNKP